MQPFPVLHAFALVNYIKASFFGVMVFVSYAHMFTCRSDVIDDAQSIAEIKTLTLSHWNG